MAEVIGALASAITIAGLFKTCIDAFDMVSTVKHTDAEYRKLSIRLGIERCRLYTWGESLGLTTSDGNSQVMLDDSQYGPLVRGTLEMISELFNDSDRIELRYGCVPQTDKKGWTPEVKQFNPLKQPEWEPQRDIAKSFSSFYVPPQPNSRSSKTKAAAKFRWLVQDRKKFSALIVDLKIFIDGLQDITKSISSLTRQKKMLEFGIQQISNLDTLELLSIACANDHPDVAEAASVKMDIMTVASTKFREIEEWIEMQNELVKGDQEHVKDFGEQSSINDLLEQAALLRQELDQARTASEKLQGEKQEMSSQILFLKAQINRLETEVPREVLKNPDPISRHGPVEGSLEMMQQQLLALEELDDSFARESERIQELLSVGNAKIDG